MENNYKEIENNLKKKRVLSWTPKYSEEFQCKIKTSVIHPITIKVFEKLGWDFIFQDENSLEAKRKNNYNTWTEKITLDFDAIGNIKVKSVTLGSELFDNGRNSLRVKLFIHVFNETLKELDGDALKKIEEDFKVESNWDDYKIPDSLPPPKQARKPSILIPILGSVIISLILAYALAYLSVKFMYVIGVFEVGVAVSIGYCYKWFIKWGNYVDGINLLIIGAVTVLLTYFGNQYFQYNIVVSENDLPGFSFLNFMELKFENGLVLEKINLGWIGLIVSWLFQLGFTYLIVYLRIYSNIANYLIEKIPAEVLDFAYYHFVKNKAEDQVRLELAKMGWEKELDQDEVFGAISGIQGVAELNRIE